MYLRNLDKLRFGLTLVIRRIVPAPVSGRGGLFFGNSVDRGLVDTSLLSAHPAAYSEGGHKQWRFVSYGNKRRYL